MFRRLAANADSNQHATVLEGLLRKAVQDNNVDAVRWCGTHAPLLVDGGESVLVALAGSNKCDLFIAMLEAGCRCTVRSTQLGDDEVVVRSLPSVQIKAFHAAVAHIRKPIVEHILTNDLIDVNVVDVVRRVRVSVAVHLWVGRAERMECGA